jgi:HD-like signal output (HDOD) protein
MTAAPAVATRKDDVPAPPKKRRHGSGPGVDTLALMRAGIDEMSAMTSMKEFPEYFVRLARRTGLRLLLLKRWTSGLQVFLEENIQVPDEAKKKRRDGRAPIPSDKKDIFQAITEDATVYSGPVPVTHFPLDLTLLLGQGSRNRQIVILPLPSQNHWNTFLYLDAESPTDKALGLAEILAHYALARMCLINKGLTASKGKVSGILKEELRRRQKRHAKQARSGPEPLPTASPTAAADPTTAGPVHDEAVSDAVLQEAPADNPEYVAEPPAGFKLTPETILHHSGELPALPKAACHIMAVIEDPGTTATKLEHALAMDQALTAKVLRIANSPFYGAVREIDTVSEAIVRLGFVSIRNWTLVTAARSVFLDPGAGMLYQKIWRQSVLSAMGGHLVAQTVGRSSPDAIFIGGLMQNIGQLILARTHPELFQEILTESTTSGRPYHEVETEKLGFDHGELGALLIKEWNLSPDLEEAVRWHHRFTTAEARQQQSAAMIALGEEIALCSWSDEHAPAGEEPLAGSRSQAADFLEISAEDLVDLKEKAKTLHIDPHFFN